MEFVSVFIGDLSYFCTEDDLVRLFEPFGEVKSAIIRRGKYGDTLHYAFVKMDSKGVQEAITKLQGSRFMGRPVRVGLNNVPNQNLMTVSNDQRSHWFQVYVNFQSKSVRVQINEDFLTNLFSRKGIVMDCVVKHYVLEMTPYHRQQGYAFVYFLHRAEALSCIRQFKQKSLDGINFDCNPCFPVSDADANPREEEEKRVVEEKDDNSRPHPTDISSNGVNSFAVDTAHNNLMMTQIDHSNINLAHVHHNWPMGNLVHSPVSSNSSNQRSSNISQSSHRQFHPDQCNNVSSSLNRNFSDINTNRRTNNYPTKNNQNSIHVPSQNNDNQTCVNIPVATYLGPIEAPVLPVQNARAGNLGHSPATGYLLPSPTLYASSPLQPLISPTPQQYPLPYTLNSPANMYVSPVVNNVPVNTMNTMGIPNNNINSSFLNSPPNTSPVSSVNTVIPHYPQGPASFMMMTDNNSNNNNHVPLMQSNSHGYQQTQFASPVAPPTVMYYLVPPALHTPQSDLPHLNTSSGQVPNYHNHHHPPTNTNHNNNNNNNNNNFHTFSNAPYPHVGMNSYDISQATPTPSMPQVSLQQRHTDNNSISATTHNHHPVAHTRTNHLKTNQFNNGSAHDNTHQHPPSHPHFR